MTEVGSRETADLISLVFNPPVLAAPTFLILLFTQRTPNPLELILITLTFGTVVPLAILYGLSKKGIILDLYASLKGSRTVLFLGAMSSYLLGTIALRLAGAPAILTSVMLCYLGNSMVMMLVNRRWKISVHASGVTGPATALIYSLGLVALPFLLLAIPVGWARLKLRAHTIAQVAAGALLTIFTTWIQLMTYLALL
jgi:membrane-associated phospholipid phosphatase